MTRNTRKRQAAMAKKRAGLQSGMVGLMVGFRAGEFVKLNNS
jgi:hypothetical protein